MISACAEGDVVAVVPNSAVSSTLLREIRTWMSDGATINDVLVRLRLKTVPTGYVIHNWEPGTNFWLCNENLKAPPIPLSWDYDPLELGTPYGSPF